MDSRLKALFLISTCLMFTSQASANDSIRTDAFITTGGSFSDSKVPFEGVTRDVNFNQLSRIGINYIFTPKHNIPISFTGQLLARGTSQWAIESEWALVSYRPSSQWLINTGKIRTALLMLSQFHDVGVSYPWTTPPEELYGFASVPFTSMSGVEAINTQFVGDWTVKTKLQLGSHSFKVPAVSVLVPVRLEQLYQFQLNAASDTLTLHLGITTGNFQSDELSTLANDLRVQGAFSGATASQILALAPTLGLSNTTNGRVEFFDVGFLYDDNFLIIAEAAKRKLHDSTFPSSQTGFITLGYHYNQFTPHITYSEISTTESFILQEQKSIILGFNISTSSSSVLKFEIKHTQIGDGSVPLGLFNIGNIGLYDTLPADLGGDQINYDATKVSVTYSVVL